jgi:hypothetical protein
MAGNNNKKIMSSRHVPCLYPQGFLSPQCLAYGPPPQGAEKPRVKKTLQSKIAKDLKAGQSELCSQEKRKKQSENVTNFDNPKAQFFSYFYYNAQRKVSKFYLLPREVR